MLVCYLEKIEFLANLRDRESEIKTVGFRYRHPASGKTVDENTQGVYLVYAYPVRIVNTCLVFFHYVEELLIADSCNRINIDRAHKCSSSAIPVPLLLLTVYYKSTHSVQCKTAACASLRKMVSACLQSFSFVVKYAVTDLKRG